MHDDSIKADPRPQANLQTFDVVDAPTSAHGICRSTDPLTSFLAAHEHIQNGTHRSQKRRVLEAVRRKPGSTSAEISAQIGADRYAAARRLPELERDGLVKRGDPRRCAINETPAITWWPIDQEAR